MFKKMKVKLRLLQSASPMKLILAGYLTIILIGTLLLLLRNGADYVSYAEREVAERLAIKFGADTIFDYVELTPEIGIYEIAVPKKWIGKNMVELVHPEQISCERHGHQEGEPDFSPAASQPCV